MGLVHCTVYLFKDLFVFAKTKFILFYFILSLDDGQSLYDDCVNSFIVLPSANMGVESITVAAILLFSAYNYVKNIKKHGTA